MTNDIGEPKSQAHSRITNVVVWRPKVMRTVANQRGFSSPFQIVIRFLSVASYTAFVDKSQLTSRKRGRNGVVFYTRNNPCQF